MKASAPTLIFCQTADTDRSWYVHALSRLEAELLYCKVVLSGDRPPPMVRFVIQLKVDQSEYAAKAPSQLYH